MGGIIIAMPKVEDARKIGEILKSRGKDMIEVCTTGDAILQKAHQYGSGVVICTRNVKDTHCRQIYEGLPKYFHMILLTSEEGIDECPGDATAVIMPFKWTELLQVVEQELWQSERNVPKEEKRVKRRSREQQQLIDMAKQVLMEQKDMTEPEAFRYIQKCSMDASTNMVETAQMILMLNKD